MAYVASTLGTYSTGTVTVVNGSTAVTGSGTVWGDIVNEGDLFTIDDDKFYYVAALNSDTSLTLDKPYAESSASGINYRVMLNTAAHFPSDVAAKVERALSGMGDVYCPIDHASSGSDYGLASASLYGHAKASGTTPKAPGTASVGTETNKFARGDHVHPHDDTKLDTAGGTLTGALIFSGNYDIRSDTNDKQISIFGGSSGNSSTGAKCLLNGSSYTYPGWFTLQAGDANGYKQLVGKPDGTLTWDGNALTTINDFIVVSSGTAQPYKFKAKFPGGVMIQGIYTTFTTDENGRFTWTFDEAFVNVPFLSILSIDPTLTIVMYVRAKTGYTFRVYKNGSLLVADNVTVCLTVVGE